MSNAFARAAAVAGLALVLPSAGQAEPKATVVPGTVYQGLCEASAAAALDDRHFAVASDEFNELYIYERGNPDPTRMPNLLGVKKSDLEAAARVGDRIYWLSSHSLKKPDKNNRNDPARRVLFATDIAPSNDGVSRLKLVGKVNGGLREALPGYSPSLDELVDIEGLAATPAGTLLVGFRRPIMSGHALVVELLNPKEATDGGAAPVLSPYHALDLGGRGIRSLELVGDGEFPYLIVAGPASDEPGFALYRWSGLTATQEKIEEVPGFDLPTGFHPEAMIAGPEPNHVQILSDDGQAVDGTGPPCPDDKTPFEDRRFRSVDVTITP